MIRITDFFPLKAQFTTDEKIVMCVEIENEDNESKSYRLEAVLSNLGDIEEVLNYEIYLEKRGICEFKIDIDGKHENNKGYGIDICLYDGDSVISTSEGSFDVVCDFRKSLRYGFLSDFYLSDMDDEEDIKNLCKLHINTVQFYDWMYRHDKLIPPVPQFSDLMGRTISFDVVKQKIELCHHYGIKTMAYGAVYAASKEFFENHRTWALYDSSNNPCNFINIFYIMNISKHSPWQKHIINEYSKAIAVGFDGIHMDTYGFPKAGISKLNNSNTIEYLEDSFPNLIENTKGVLEKMKDNVCLIFNNVGNWPVKNTAASELDCVYIEVWKPYERYEHLQQLIREAKAIANGKRIILAAYLKPFLGEKGEKANISALILTSVIAANGANHLLLGENKGVLTQGYYVDYSVLKDDFFIKIRKYYDFIVRYSNLLYDDELIDVSMTHSFGDNKEYEFENGDFSPYGESGKIWTIIRQNRNRSLISLINLTNNSEEYWNIGKNPPTTVHHVLIKMQILKEVRKAFIASPDTSIKEENVKYKMIDDSRGKSILIEVPKLELWSILLVEFDD